MEINWDSIKYIFQIPRDWFRYIHRKIHNAYGVLFIRVMDGEYGGMKIDIDKQVFKETVEDAIKLDEYVKSVNDVKPDKNGNVDLDTNFLEASDITTPGIVVGTDYKGEQTVCSPNHKHNIKDVDGSIKTINGNSPDENGNVVVPSVLKVNNVEPDETGNVDLGTLVKSVNDHEPDENGKITFSVVERVDGVESVNGNVPLGAIRSINNTIRPVNGNVDLTNVFAPVEHTHPHTQISDWNNATKDFLKASELTSPGIVVGTDYDDPDHPVCYPNHKHNAKDIVNDEESGFVTINTEQNITASKRFTNGSNLSVANSDSEGVFVKPTGQITISANTNCGFKMANNQIANLNTNPFQILQDNGNGSPMTFLQQINGTLTLVNNVDEPSISVLKDSVFIASKANDYNNPVVSVSTNGILLTEDGGNSNNSSVVQLQDGVRIRSKTKCGFLATDNQAEIQVPVGDSSKKILLAAAANNAKLYNQPTDTNEDSLAIATCGYVQKNAITTPEGKELKTYDATFVSDVTWDGTKIIVRKMTLEFTKGVLTAVKNAASRTIDTVAYTPS